MMRLFRQLEVGLLAFGAFFSLNAGADDLIGVWYCGPYEMKSGDMAIRTKEQKHYRVDGSYSEIAISTVRFGSGVVTTMKMRLDGRWQQQADEVTVQFDKATFLSSDNPNYTIAMGQLQADSQMAKKNWAKSLVLVLGDKMMYRPIDAMYKETEVEVRCINPVAGSGLQ